MEDQLIAVRADRTEADGQEMDEAVDLLTGADRRNG